VALTLLSSSGCHHLACPVAGLPLEAALSWLWCPWLFSSSWSHLASHCLWHSAWLLLPAFKRCVVYRSPTNRIFILGSGQTLSKKISDLSSCHADMWHFDMTFAIGLWLWLSFASFVCIHTHQSNPSSQQSIRNHGAEQQYISQYRKFGLFSSTHYHLSRLCKLASARVK
jgi:hypothetical protein